MLFKIRVCSIAFLFFTGALFADTSCLDTEKYDKLMAAWKSAKPSITIRTNPAYTSGDLYNVQLQTNLMIEYADRCKDYAVIEDIVNLYSPALPLLTSASKYHIYYAPDGKYHGEIDLGAEYKMLSIFMLAMRKKF